MAARSPPSSRYQNEIPLAHSSARIVWTAMAVPDLQDWPSGQGQASRCIPAHVQSEHFKLYQLVLSRYQDVSMEYVEHQCHGRTATECASVCAVVHDTCGLQCPPGSASPVWEPAWAIAPGGSSVSCGESPPWPSNPVLQQCCWLDLQGPAAH